MFKIRRDLRPRPGLPPPQPALEAAGGEANAAIAEANVEEFVLQLDDPEMGQYQNAFLDAEEDGDFWDDDNIAAFLGVLDE